MSQLTIVPSRERFEELAKLGNVVPVFVDFVADGQTPAGLSKNWMRRLFVSVRIGRAD